MGLDPTRQDSLIIPYTPLRGCFSALTSAPSRDGQSPTRSGVFGQQNPSLPTKAAPALRRNQVTWRQQYSLVDANGR